MALTDTQIRNSKPGQTPVKITDGGGLYLELRPTGAKLWRYRYRIDGKENVFAVGEYVQAPAGESAEQAQIRRDGGMLTLAEARTKREECRALVKQGIHPAHQRQATRAEQSNKNGNTFEVIAREWIEKKKPGWSPYYLGQVEHGMQGDVYPAIGRLPIRNITAAHILEIIQRVEKRGAPTVALNLRQWTSAVFRYAVVTLRADADPAAALRGAIHRPPVEHHKALSRDQMVDFVKALDGYAGYTTTTIALRLMLLTFVRTVELRTAPWSEFDLDRAEWRIPAERMKMRDTHIVPLSRQAVALLRELHTFTGGRSHLFPNLRNPQTFMTATTLNRALERMGFNGKDTIGFSAHGFRATASTMLNELGYRKDVIERQLAHAERDKTRASYNHAEYLPERTAMMQQWADLIDSIAAGNDKVTPIKQAAA